MVVALPWSKVGDVLDPAIAAQLPWLEAMRAVESAPITGVHLWFDRPIMTLPHAVLVGRLSQWIFNRGPRQEGGKAGHYYQVVISASRQLAGRDRDEIAREVCGELATIWPAARQPDCCKRGSSPSTARCFRRARGWSNCVRRSGLRSTGLFLAGDWTATGWPATMEGAVRSGYLAAEGILQTLGRPRKFLVSDLERGLLARILIR